MGEINLEEIDKLEITVLIDNYIDIFMESSSKVDFRPKFFTENPLRAEHGLSCLVKLFKGSEEHLILMDFGISEDGLFHNANALNIDLDGVDSTFLSHGHFDHIGGILKFMDQFPNVPLFIHPDAFLERRLNNPSAGPVDIADLNENILTEMGVKIIKSEGPSTMASNMVLLTGKVERTTPFEKGFPWAETKIKKEWIVDPFNDDQGLVVKLKDKGLVVISGCAHAGIINTVRYAQKLTGINEVHAVLGGFHLTGSIFEPIIQPTIEEMKKIDPDYIVPMHCTGWNTINCFKEAMPDKVIMNTVGTTYIFE